MEKLELGNLFIFGQLGYFPVMSKPLLQGKHRRRGKLVRYPRRDEPRHLWVEETDGTIRRHRAVDFHPYASTCDPVAAFRQSVQHVKFNNETASKQGKEDEEDDENQEESSQNKVKAVDKDQIEATALAANKNKYKQEIPTTIKATTPNPATRYHTLRYSDRELWAKSLDAELDKLDSYGTIQWLKPAELGIIPKNTKIISMTLTFNYKRSKNGEVEERKSRASLRGDIMSAGKHYNTDHASAPMVYRTAVRMVISYCVDKGWYQPRALRCHECILARRLWSHRTGLCT